MRVPCWEEVLVLSRRVAEAVGLGYIGVDIVLDAEHGPMLLEANARPGLAIQIANARGLLPRLAEIDALKDRPPAVKATAEPDIIGPIGEPLRRSA
jgi:glutathione synthase/RimK-type ligase-like ATP-grasp enzyme